MTRLPLIFAVFATAACASGNGARQANAQTPPVTSVTPVDTTRAMAPASDTIPVGFGSLKQDELTVAIRTGPLLLKVTPLNENVIRLFAPDTYRRLHALAESRRSEASKGIGTRELFLISFYSYEPDVTFQPEDVQLEHQTRTLRPDVIVPLTPGWGKQRMMQQENQSAIYAFEGPIDYQQDLVMHYGMEQTSAWHDMITRMHVERTKIKTRSGR